MEELIETYSDQIGDVAVSLCASLVRKHLISNVHTYMYTQLIKVLIYKSDPLNFNRQFTL